jgi:hypothetical protein
MSAPPMGASFESYPKALTPFTSVRSHAGHLITGRDGHYGSGRATVVMLCDCEDRGAALRFAVDENIK